KYSDFYIAGAAGPDVIGNLVGELYPIAKNTHYKRTGAFIVNMIKISNQQKVSSKRAAYLAYALGWMTHYFLDIHEHKIVNDYAGLYKVNPERHITLEMLETAHVFEISEHKKTGPYIAPAKGLPIGLIQKAFGETYSRNIDIYGGIVRGGLSSERRIATRNIRKFAGLMENFTRVVRDEYRKQQMLLKMETSRVRKFGLGHIPMRGVYWNILRPIDVWIEKIVWDPKVKPGDKKGIFAQVTWQITDNTLQVGYLTDWYKANSLVIDLIVSKFKAFGARRKKRGLYLQFSDMNLDTGHPESAGYSKAEKISRRFKNIKELELEWKVLSKNGKTLHSDKKLIDIRGKKPTLKSRMPFGGGPRYVQRRKGKLSIYIPAKAPLFCWSNQKLKIKVRLRMLNNNTHLMRGPYVTSFRFRRGNLSKGVKVDKSRKVPIEASNDMPFPYDMPGLQNCASHVERRQDRRRITQGKCDCDDYKRDPFSFECVRRGRPPGCKGSIQRQKPGVGWGGMNPREFSPRSGVGSQ
ncbi:MAG: zinc dependent phospholipase C family protein, partial [Waddliaceae bacterium]